MQKRPGNPTNFLSETEIKKFAVEPILTYDSLIFRIDEENRLMRKPLLGMAFLWMMLSIGLSVESAEDRSFQPDQIRIGRIDVRDEPFNTLVPTVEKASGLKIEIHPRLKERHIALSVNNITLECFLETVLPSQGASWERVDPSTLRFYPQERPWHGPIMEKEIILDQPIRKNIQTGSLSLQQLLIVLSEAYKINCIADYRIKRMPFNPNLNQVTLEEALENICVPKGLQWKYTGDMLVVLPSEWNQVMDFKCPKWQHWSYSQIDMSGVAEDLAVDLGVPIYISRDASNNRVTGSIYGRTVGEVLDILCRDNFLLYGAADKALFVVKRTEVTKLTKDAVLPNLTVQVYLMEFPRKSLGEMSLGKWISESRSMPPEEIQQKLLDLKNLNGYSTLLDRKISLSHENLAEQRVEMDSPSFSGKATLSARFQFLEKNYGMLEIFLREHETSVETPRILAVMDKSLIRFDRPFFYFSQPEIDYNPNIIRLFYLEFDFPKVLQENQESYYQTILWVIPRGYSHQTDLIRKGYYRQFPGPWENLFLPKPFNP